MKEVKIRIKGDLVIVDYCSQKVIEENIKNGEAVDEESALVNIQSTRLCGNML